MIKFSRITSLTSTPTPLPHPLTLTNTPTPGHGPHYQSLCTGHDLPTPGANKHKIIKSL